VSFSVYVVGSSHSLCVIVAVVVVVVIIIVIIVDGVFAALVVLLLFYHIKTILTWILIRVLEIFSLTN
jgi:hypothetical protein